MQESIDHHAQEYLTGSLLEFEDLAWEEAEFPRLVAKTPIKIEYSLKVEVNHEKHYKIRTSVLFHGEQFQREQVFNKKQNGLVRWLE